jgi:hypothetical protein
MWQINNDREIEPNQKNRAEENVFCKKSFSENSQKMNFLIVRVRQIFRKEKKKEKRKRKRKNDREAIVPCSLRQSDQNRPLSLPSIDRRSGAARSIRPPPLAANRRTLLPAAVRIESRLGLRDVR